MRPESLAGRSTPQHQPSMESLDGVRLVRGVYYPSGAQLNTVGNQLEGKMICVSGHISGLSAAWTSEGETEIALPDGKATVIFAWNDCPAAIRSTFERRSSARTAMREGTSIDVTGTLLSSDGVSRAYIRPTSVRQGR